MKEYLSDNIMKVERMFKYDKGFVNTAKCDLSYKIIQKGSYKAPYKVQFEDGCIVEVSQQALMHNRFGHPLIRARGTGSYAGFSTHGLGFEYLQCECQKCGFKDILTTQQMKEGCPRCQQ